MAVHRQWALPFSVDAHDLEFIAVFCREENKDREKVMVLIHYLHKGIQDVLCTHFRGGRGSKAPAEKAQLRLPLLKMWGGHKDTNQVVCCYRSPVLPIL